MRKIIQISAASEGPGTLESVYALCDNGDLLNGQWENGKFFWIELPAIPIKKMSEDYGPPDIPPPESDTDDLISK